MNNDISQTVPKDIEKSKNLHIACNCQAIREIRRENKYRKRVDIKINLMAKNRKSKEYFSRLRSIMEAKSKIYLRKM